MSTENKAKAREFWIFKDDKLQNDCVLESEPFGTHSSRYVHVIEISSLTSLQSQLDEKTAECDKLKLQLKNRSSHLQTATVDGIHKAWEANAKLRAELEAAKAEIARLNKELVAKRTLNALISDNAEICEQYDINDKLEAENKRLREALDKIAILGSGSKAYTSSFTTETMGIAREALKGDAE